MPRAPTGKGKVGGLGAACFLGSDWQEGLSFGLASAWAPCLFCAPEAIACQQAEGLTPNSYAVSVFFLQSQPFWTVFFQIFVTF